MASLRARLGVSDGGVMAYLTGGVAFADFDDKFKTSAEDDDETLMLESRDVNQTETGLVVGAGIEKLVSDSLSLGIEGLYYHFGKESEKYVKTVEEISKLVTTREKDNNAFAVRARLTYHLN